MRPRLTRQTSLALAAMVLAPALSTAAEVKLVRVWPDYRPGESFVRIAEYFGGAEKSPELVVRSQADARAGYYFLARFETTHALPGSIIAVEYFMPGEDAARVKFFPVDLPRGSRAILAGLTGADWPGEDITPTAWRLRLLDSTGQEVAREQSYLWALPAASVDQAPPRSE